MIIKLYCCGQNINNFKKSYISPPLSRTLSFFGDLFGGGDAGDAANQYYSQIPDILKKYLGPYADRGNQVYGGLENQYNQMMNDPSGLMNKFGQGYKQSPGYQFQVNQATGAANNAASATRISLVITSYIQ